MEYAERVAIGTRPKAEEAKRHARFAASLCMSRLVCEGDVGDEECVWGRDKGITKSGVSRGALQRLQAQLSKWAGMAGQMCASAGWWQLEGVLSSLSEQAAAGARPELLQLMQVRGVGDAHALIAPSNDAIMRMLKPLSACLHVCEQLCLPHSSDS